MSIAAQLAALEGAFQDQGVTAVLSPLTSDFAGTQGSVGELAPSLEQFTASFEGPGSFDGSIAGTLAELTGSFHVPDSLHVTLERAEGSFSGVVGTIGSIDSRLELLAGGFSGLPEQPGAIAATLPFLVSSFSGTSTSPAQLDASLRALRGEFSGVAGTAGSMAGTLAQLDVSLVGHADGAAVLDAEFARMFASFGGEQAVVDDFKAWAVNTRRGGVTEYTSFPYNSLARYNGAYLAASASGLVKLEGELDLGADIAWDVQTGFHDDGEPGLKRLPEVLFGLRADGPVKVRVWGNEDESYLYTLTIHKSELLHQARVKCGKGLRSRYFRVALSGTGPSLELDSLQLPMTKTTRRQG